MYLPNSELIPAAIIFVKCKQKYSKEKMFLYRYPYFSKQKFSKEKMLFFYTATHIYHLSKLINYNWEKARIWIQIRVKIQAPDPSSDSRGQHPLPEHILVQLLHLERRPLPVLQGSLPVI